MKTLSIVRGRRNQSGAALFVATIFVIVLSLLAVAMANTSIMQKRMASAMRDMQLARVASMSAMSMAQAEIPRIAMTRGIDQVCNVFKCFVRAPGDVRTGAVLIDSGDGQARLNAFAADLTEPSDRDASTRLAAQPGFLIEDFGPAATDAAHERAPTHIFRVTSSGTGIHRETRFVSESICEVAVTSDSSETRP